MYVPGGSALCAHAPHDTTYTGPRCLDPEKDISGSPLCHGVRLATSHPPFINGGHFGSLSFIPGQLLCSIVLASSWGVFILLLSFSLPSWGVVYGGGTFPQGHGGYPRAATLVAPSLAFAGLSLHPSLMQDDHHSSSGSDITMSFSSPGRGLPLPHLYHPRTWMTISVGTATNMGWSMGLPPQDVPSSSFEFGSQASLGIPLVSLFF